MFCSCCSKALQSRALEVSRQEATLSGAGSAERLEKDKAISARKALRFAGRSGGYGRRRTQDARPNGSVSDVCTLVRSVQTTLQQGPGPVHVHVAGLDKILGLLSNAI